MWDLLQQLIIFGLCADSMPVYCFSVQTKSTEKEGKHIVLQHWNPKGSVSRCSLLLFQPSSHKVTTINLPATSITKPILTQPLRADDSQLMPQFLWLWRWGYHAELALGCDCTSIYVTLSPFLMYNLLLVWYIVSPSSPVSSHQTKVFFIMLH